jgi:soluble lytic murein transglycosylase
VVKNRTTFILTAVLLSLPMQTAHADIYKYTDESGVIHFTNVSGGRNHKRVRSEPVIAPARIPVPGDAAPAAAKSSSPGPSAGIPSLYMDIINAACDKHGVDPSLVRAIVKVESDFNPFALSRKGAMGLMQLMPQTAVEMDVKNSFSPHDNIDGGVKYLRYLLDRYEGNLSLALAAYNSGETAVKRWGTIPPFRETQKYVQKILRLYNGRGKTFMPRYTIYIGYGEDGALLLTDNPSSHEGKALRRASSRNL